MDIYSLHHRAHVRHPMLPKASLIKVTFFRFPCGFKWSTMRMANALRIQAWRFEIVVRRPWLAGPARQLHPELWQSAQRSTNTDTREAAGHEQ